MKIKGIIKNLKIKNKNDNSKNISRNSLQLLWAVWGQIAPCSSLYFSRSLGPIQCLVNINYRVLICCTCHFQSGSLFIYFGFLCFQVSSMFNFHPDTRGAKVVTYLGSLVQLCCGEGGTLKTNITGMCGEYFQCLDHTGFAPADVPYLCFLSLHCSGSWLLCGELSKACTAFRALPGS